MTGPTCSDSYSENAAENYERYLVPAIGRPVAAALVDAAAPAPGERVPDEGFDVVEVRSEPVALRLPPPEDFLWQYVHRTPMAAVVAQVDEERRAALERDFSERCRDLDTDGALVGAVRMTTLTTRRWGRPGPGRMDRDSGTRPMRQGKPKEWVRRPRPLLRGPAGEPRRRPRPDPSGQGPPRG